MAVGADPMHTPAAVNALPVAPWRASRSLHPGPKYGHADASASVYDYRLHAPDHRRPIADANVMTAPISRNLNTESDSIVPAQLQ